MREVFREWVRNDLGCWRVYLKAMASIGLRQAGSGIELVDVIGGKRHWSERADMKV